MTLKKKYHLFAPIWENLDDGVLDQNLTHQFRRLYRGALTSLLSQGGPLVVRISNYMSVQFNSKYNRFYGL